MAPKLPPISGKSVIAAFTGGLAAAIMVAAAGKHLAVDGKIYVGAAVPGRQIVPMMLACLSPLPLMITTVGFGTLSGAIAVIVGAAAFGALAPLLIGGSLSDQHMLLVAGLRGVGFAVTFGLPALLLGSFASRQPKAPVAIDPVPNARTMRPEEQLVGRVLAIAIAVAALLSAVAAVLLIQSKGGYAAFLQELIKEFQPLLAAEPSVKKLDPALIARVLIWVSAPTIAAELVCIFVLNIWLAGRIAQTSGLLATPWPDLPQNLRVPRLLAVLAAIAFGLSFAGGFVGLVSIIVAGAVTAGFALQGLAVVHALSRGRSWRTPMLLSIYLALCVLPPLMLIFAVIGLCDTAFFFRDREKVAAEQKTGPWS